MARFFAALVAVLILVLGSTKASAQDLPMPGRGGILELRRDDPRNQEGYRSFIFGSYVSGMDGLDDVLDRVNADLEGDSLVTMEQLDAANPCSVIYHREGHNGYNGICGGNSTEARVTFASFCDGDRFCVRWPMAGRVYRIPSLPRLTPGERVEEMVRRLDETTVTETVPAPAELGGWLTELSDSMSDADQRPTYEQVQGGIAAIGRTLVRTPSAPTAAVDPSTPDMTLTEEDVLGTSEDIATSRTTSAEDGEEHTSSTSDGATTSILSNPTLLWSIIVILSVMMIILLFKDNIRAWYRPTSLDIDQEPPAPEIAPPAPSMEQVRESKMYATLKRRWQQYYRKLDRNEQLTEESLLLFFDAAETNRVLVGAREEKIKELESRPALPEPQVIYRADTKRVDELAGLLAVATAAKVVAETRATNAEAGLAHNKEAFDTFKTNAKKLVDIFYQQGIANLELAFDHATSSDTSQPGLIGTLKRIDQAREQFEGMVAGVLNDLLIHLESDLAMAPSTLSVPLFHDRVSASDSWTGPLDESVPELEDGRMSLPRKSVGAGAFAQHAPSLEPGSVPPKQNDDSIPPRESLVGEPTHPGMRAPEPGQSDDVVFDPVAHAIPPAGKAGRAQRRRERKRRITDSFETAPKDRVTRDDEGTAVIDTVTLDQKRVEARTGKTISPPSYEQVVKPEPASAALKPGMASLYEEPSGTASETGVTTKRVVNND